MKNAETGVVRELPINIGRNMISLIDAGGFDSCEQYEDRNHIQASFIAVRDFLQKNDADDTGTLELGIADERRSAADFIDRSGAPMSPLEKLRKEKELLGLYLSGHPLGFYAGLDAAVSTLSGPLDACAFSKTAKNHVVRVCGIIEDIYVKQTADRRVFATFSLETRKDKYNMICFASDYEENKGQIADGAQVVIDCELRYRDRQEEWSLQAVRISPLREQLPKLLKKVSFVLDADADVPAFLEKKLLPHLRENSGGTRVALAVRRPDDSLVECDLPEAAGTFFPAEKFAALVKDPAVVGYAVETSAPYRRPSRFPGRA